MPTALLYWVAAFTVTVLLGLILAAATRGLEINRHMQDKRYARQRLRSDLRAREIRTADHLRRAQLAAARREQVDRHTEARHELNRWHREYSGY